jgi:hypothetical protein
VSLSLSTLRTGLRKHLGVDSTELPDAEADELLNRSWWFISSELDFHEREATYSFVTVDGDDTYDLPTDSDAIEAVTINHDDDDAVIPLIKIDDYNMFQQLDLNSSYEDKPTHYSIRNDEFILHPIPDQEYTVRVRYLQTLSDLSTSGPPVPREWHEVILWGAVSRGFFSLGDYNRGNAAEAQVGKYLQSLTTRNAREQIDRRYSGLRVIKRGYP